MFIKYIIYSKFSYLEFHNNIKNIIINNKPTSLIKTKMIGLIRNKNIKINKQTAKNIKNIIVKILRDHA